MRVVSFYTGTSGLLAGVAVGIGNYKCCLLVMSQVPILTSYIFRLAVLGVAIVLFAMLAIIVIGVRLWKRHEIILNKCPLADNLSQVDASMVRNILYYVHIAMAKTVCFSDPTCASQALRFILR